MKPIFTIHAGEYLVAAEIEKSHKSATVWIPSKDTGIDLLLTDKTNKKTVSLQVKFSKDFNLTHNRENLRPNIKGFGWWTLNRKKIENSQADFWIFIVYSLEKKSHNYIVIEPNDLLTKFDSLKRTESKVHCYFTVTEFDRAFETRGLSSDDLENLCLNKFSDENRDVSKYLNNWTPIMDRLQ